MRPQPSPFLRALAELLTGARHAHELAELLATEAVQRTLVRVAADHPLDYAELLRRYQADVVRECCAMLDTADAADAAQTCGAKTRAGKPCAKRAVLNGVCAQHVDHWRAQQASQRRQDVYAESVRHAAATDPYADELRELGRKRSVAMAFPDDVAGALS